MSDSTVITTPPNSRLQPTISAFDAIWELLDDNFFLPLFAFLSNHPLTPPIPYNDSQLQAYQQANGTSKIVPLFDNAQLLRFHDQIYPFLAVEKFSTITVKRVQARLVHFYNAQLAYIVASVHNSSLQEAKIWVAEKLWTNKERLSLPDDSVATMHLQSMLQHIQDRHENTFAAMRVVFFSIGTFPRLHFDVATFTPSMMDDHGPFQLTAGLLSSSSLIPPTGPKSNMSPAVFSEKYTISANPVPNVPLETICLYLYSTLCFQHVMPCLTGAIIKNVHLLRLLCFHQIGITLLPPDDRITIQNITASWNTPDIIRFYKHGLSSLLTMISYVDKQSTTSHTGLLSQVRQHILLHTQQFYFWFAHHWFSQSQHNLLSHITPSHTVSTTTTSTSQSSSSSSSFPTFLTESPSITSTIAYFVQIESILRIEQQLVRHLSIDNFEPTYMTTVHQRLILSSPVLFVSPPTQIYAPITLPTNSIITSSSSSSSSSSSPSSSLQSPILPPVNYNTAPSSTASYSSLRLATASPAPNLIQTVQTLLEVILTHNVVTSPIMNQISAFVSQNISDTPPLPQNTPQEQTFAYVIGYLSALLPSIENHTSNQRDILGLDVNNPNLQPSHSLSSVDFARGILLLIFRILSIVPQSLLVLEIVIPLIFPQNIFSIVLGTCCVALGNDSRHCQFPLDPCQPLVLAPHDTTISSSQRLNVVEIGHAAANTLFCNDDKQHSLFEKAFIAIGIYSVLTLLPYNRIITTATYNFVQSASLLQDEFKHLAPFIQLNIILSRPDIMLQYACIPALNALYDSFLSIWTSFPKNSSNTNLKSQQQQQQQQKSSSLSQLSFLRNCFRASLSKLPHLLVQKLKASATQRIIVPDVPIESSSMTPLRYYSTLGSPTFLEELSVLHLNLIVQSANVVFPQHKSRLHVPRDTILSSQLAPNGPSLPYSPLLSNAPPMSMITLVSQLISTSKLAALLSNKDCIIELQSNFMLLRACSPVQSHLRLEIFTAFLLFSQMNSSHLNINAASPSVLLSLFRSTEAISSSVYSSTDALWAHMANDANFAALTVFLQNLLQSRYVTSPWVKPWASAVEQTYQAFYTGSNKSGASSKDDPRFPSLQKTPPSTANINIQLTYAPRSFWPGKCPDLEANSMIVQPIDTKSDSAFIQSSKIQFPRVQLNINKSNHRISCNPEPNASNTPAVNAALAVNASPIIPTTVEPNPPGLPLTYRRMPLLPYPLNICASTIRTFSFQMTPHRFFNFATTHGTAQMNYILPHASRTVLETQEKAHILQLRQSRNITPTQNNKTIPVKLPLSCSTLQMEILLLFNQLPQADISQRLIPVNTMRRVLNISLALLDSSISPLVHYIPLLRHTDNRGVDLSADTIISNSSYFALNTTASLAQSSYVQQFISSLELLNAQFLENNVNNNINYTNNNTILFASHHLAIPATMQFFPSVIPVAFLSQHDQTTAAATSTTTTTTAPTAASRSEIPTFEQKGRGSISIKTDLLRKTRCHNAIIKILKTSHAIDPDQGVTLTELFEQAREKCADRFDLDIAYFKQSVEALVDGEYIWRDEDDLQLLFYNA